MKIDPSAVMKPAIDVAPGTFCFVCLSPSQSAYALRGRQPGTGGDGFAILAAAPHWLTNQGLGVIRVLEMPGAQLAPVLNAESLRFYPQKPLGGSIGFTGAGTFLAVDPGIVGFGPLYVNIETGEVPLNAPIGDAIWCRQWAVGYHRAGGFDEIFRFQEVAANE